MSSKDLLYIGLIAFVFLIIIGLYISEFSPLNISEKERILKEEFSNPSKSTALAQTKGASQYYKWGLPEDNASTYTKKDCSKPKVDDDDVPPFSPKPIENDCLPEEKKSCSVSSKFDCYNCDITKNKDISKYVLKSSVPPCPDVSKYATKNMIQACPDISKYILKSEIPGCEKFDKSKYILKTEVPACPKCPICPICPTCPSIPKQTKCKTINQYKITDHPDLSNYIAKDNINQYIKDNQICKNIITDKIDSKKKEIQDRIYQKKNELQINNSQKKKELQDRIYQKKKYIQNRIYQKKKEMQEKGTSRLDRIFAETSDLKNSSSNLQGAYAGDSLFAVY